MNNLFVRLVIIIGLIALAYWANYLVVKKQEVITNTVVVEKPVEVEKIIYVDRPIIIEKEVIKMVNVCFPKTAR